MRPLRTILHPTDSSAPSEHALSLACGLARARGARLIALHVVEPQIDFGELGMTAPRPSWTIKPSRSGWPGSAPRTRRSPVEHQVVEGGAADEIVRAARETQCDLIVMGSHGRTGLGRVVMGSVAEKVFHEARCPVLIVRTARPETGSEVEAPGPKSVLVF
jgi:nucleotide-binding universal stress UspA family protein